MSSVSKNLWQRLTRNAFGITGLLIIVAAVFVAVFAYAIVPDATPNADREIVEIGSKPAGFTQMFLLLPTSISTKQNFLQQIFSGQPDRHVYLPISSWQRNGTGIIVQKFVDEGKSVRQEFRVDSLTDNGRLPLKDLIVTKQFILGTDAFGRDIFSRLIVGTRVSLAVGLVAVLISLTLGILLGALAGYYGGRFDNIIMWLINVTWSIPTLLLVFAVTLAIGKGFWQIFIAVGLTLWVGVARLVRGQVLAAKELEYVQAARILGYSDRRILLRHILPNISGPIIVIAAGNFATAIIIEAGLSFLGIGVQPPQPSWGLMMKENYSLIISHNPFQALVPGFAIMLLVLAFNFLGTALTERNGSKRTG